VSARPIPDFVDGPERRAWAREEARAEREAERTETPLSDPFTAALVDEILNGPTKPRRNRAFRGNH